MPLEQGALLCAFVFQRSPSIPLLDPSTTLFEGKAGMITTQTREKLLSAVCCTWGKRE